MIFLYRFFDRPDFYQVLLYCSFSVSYIYACRFNQKSSLVPKKRDNLSAISVERDLLSHRYTLL